MENHITNADYESDKEKNIVKLMDATGAIKRGHFQLSSGLHSGTYFQCAKLLEDPKNAMYIAGELAGLFKDGEIDLVASPAVGGIVIGFAVALHIGKDFVFAERDAGSMSLRRGFEIRPEQNVLVVEDVITTGGSALEVAKLVTTLGANVTGIGTIIQRAEVSLPYELKPLLKMNTTAHPARQCPLCKDGIPLSSPGSRRPRKEIHP